MEIRPILLMMRFSFIERLISFWYLELIKLKRIYPFDQVIYNRKWEDAIETTKIKRMDFFFSVEYKEMKPLLYYI
jgi:hypothetical protein